MWTKITKTMARKLFENFETVYLLPNKINPNNVWVRPFAINYDSELSFDGAVNHYKWYNCNNECGNIVAYYVKDGE